MLLLTENYLQLQKWCSYKGRGIVSTPICANKVRNGPAKAASMCTAPRDETRPSPLSHLFYWRKTYCSANNKLCYSMYLHVSLRKRVVFCYTQMQKITGCVPSTLLWQLCVQHFLIRLFSYLPAKKHVMLI